MLKNKNTKKKVIERFPRKELNAWLKGRECWDHDEWLDLLDDLRRQGFTKWTESQDGQNEIGSYLEESRVTA
ncbi:MAG: hypothetical protein ACD_62C00351G0004 [uncultured bacterium]|nr:MAG: hypothetical protein ACD_62C00351G0004 [uncultured bacterium]HLD45806.1 hypothetical protein [bacterium]